MKYTKNMFAAILFLCMVISLAACGNVDTEADKEPAETVITADIEKSEGVMTYAEYMASDIDLPVVVETYVQAKRYLKDGMATFYTQDAEGAYFVYKVPCTDDMYEQIQPGTKLRVTGTKSEWSGETEIVDASIEILDGFYLAKPVDVTEYLGTPELSDYQNFFVSFNDMTVEAVNQDGDAFLYNWDGNGSDGDDLYFNISHNGVTYKFTVEADLCDSSTEVYNAVKKLHVGEKVNMEGFLYWYEGVNPHITSVTVVQK